MKKRRSKLTLSRETLRRLDPAHLKDVMGGTSLGGLCTSANCPQPSEDEVSCQPNNSDCKGTCNTE